MITAAQAAQLRGLVEDVLASQNELNWQSEYGNGRGYDQAETDLEQAKAKLDEFIKGITK